MNDSIGRAATGIKKTLIVEDTQSVADFIREMLQAFGHHGEIALSVNHALETFSPGKYDLIITDYTMPGMNGIEFARQIRERSPQQLILLITGSTFSLGQTAGVQMPVNAILQKPFSVTEFQEILNGLFALQASSLANGDLFEEHGHHQKHSASRDPQSPAQGGVRSFDGRASA